MGVSMIGPFRGRGWFLSNFYPAPASFDGVSYPTSEHAFNAAKTLDPMERELVRACKAPGDAKRAGRKVTLRPNWDEYRLVAMDAVLASKFQDPALLTLLLETGDEELCEVNEWHDQFWGVCSCPKHGGTGENNLGKALMRLRASLRDAL